MIEGLSFFGKTAKPKGFNFKPRYFDEAKDEIGTRLNKKRAQRVIESDLETGKRRSAIKFSQKGPKEVNSGSNLRLIALIALLLMLGYWLLTSKF